MISGDGQLRVKRVIVLGFFILLKILIFTTSSVNAQIPNFIWSVKAGGTSSDFGNAITTDGLGNSIVTGSFKGTATFGTITLTSTGGTSDSDIFIVKYDAFGNLLWVRQAGGVDIDEGFGVRLDGSGNITVTGLFRGTARFDTVSVTSAGLEDIFIAKYDASGNLLWVRRAGGTSGDVGLGVAVDGLGNSIITGFFQGTATFGTINLVSTGGSDIFIAKYDAAGNVIWARRAGGVGFDVGNSTVIDGSGNSILTGQFQGTATFGNLTLTAAGGVNDFDIFIAKYDASGNVIWAKRAGGSGPNDSGNGITVDGGGNSILTGQFQGTATFDTVRLTAAGGTADLDIFIAKYDISGNLLWVRQAGGTSLDVGTSIASDGAGNSVVTGSFRGTSTFNTTSLTSARGDDIFTAKYDTSGNLLWVKQAGGSGDDVGNGLVALGSGDIFLTGQFQGTATFDTTTLTSTGNFDIFTSRLSSFIPTPTPTPTPGFPIHLVIDSDDYDGDRTTDFAVWRPTEGNWYTLGFQGNPGIQTWGVEGDIPVPGDYDGDGVADKAIWRPGDGTWWILFSSNGFINLLAWGLPGDIPVPADYDGDLLTDVGVWRPSEGNWYILSSTGSVFLIPWGLPGDIPVPGDYDGDKVADVAIWRPSEGNWYILFLSTGGVGLVPWGLPGDIPVPGDYDGDGITDPAIWRPSEGNWWITFPTGAFSLIPWGISGDIPTPGDYDGDGIADIAVWRPSEGNWYVLLSTGSFSLVPWGIPGDIPVSGSGK